MKNKLALLLAAAMITSLIGCSETLEPSNSTSNSTPVSTSGSTSEPEEIKLNPVNLTWMYLAVGEQEDEEMAFDNFNTLLAEHLPNTTVEFLGVTAAEYKTEWGLVAASGEVIDIAWAGYAVPFLEEVNKKSYLELNDLIAEYGQDLTETIPEWIWEMSKVDGEIYAVPNYQITGGGRYAFRTSSALADEYLDMDAITSTFYAAETFDESCYDALETYLQALKDSGNLGLGLSTYFPVTHFKGYDQVATRYFVKESDLEAGKYEVEYMYLLPEYELHFEKMADFFEKGFIREDILGLEKPRGDEGKEDGYSVWVNTNVFEQAETDSTRYGWDIDIIPISEEFRVGGSLVPTTASAIPYMSENPERAMMLLNLINTAEGKDLYTALTLGVEGTHYTLSDGVVETLDYSGTPKTDSPFGINDWVMGNTFNGYPRTSDVEGYDEFVLDVIHETSTKSPLISFRFDNSAVALEMQQVESINPEFVNPMNIGVLGADWESTFTEYKEKLETAGVEKVRAEIERQINEYMAAQG